MARESARLRPEAADTSQNQRMAAKMRGRPRRLEAVLLGFVVGSLCLSVCRGQCSEQLDTQDVVEALASLSSPPASWTAAPSGPADGLLADVCSAWEGIGCASRPGNCSSLESISLSGAQLLGTLPASWSSITSLVSISLPESSLTGSLPPEWSTLAQLEALDLSRNQLTGTVPSEWSTLAKAKSLYLADNTGLTGTFPELWLLSLHGLNTPEHVTAGTNITIRELNRVAAQCFHEHQLSYSIELEPSDLLQQCEKCSSTAYAWYIICEPESTYLVAYLALAVVFLAELTATLTRTKSPAAVTRWRVHGAHRWNLALRLVLLVTVVYNALCVIPGVGLFLRHHLSAEALAVKAFGNTMLAFGFIVVWWSWQMVSMITRKLRRLSWLSKLSQEVDTSEVRHSRDWTLAASQDVFLETAAAVQEQQTKLMGMAVVGIAGSTLTIVIKQSMGAWVDLSNIGLPLESLSTQLNIVNFILFGYALMVTILLPENLFTNSAVMLAIRWHGNLHLKRLTSFHWITAATMPLGVMCFIPIDGKASLTGLALAVIPVALLLAASITRLPPTHRGPERRNVRLWREILTTILPLSVLNLGLVSIVVYSAVTDYSCGYIPAALCVTFQLYMLLWLDAGVRVQATGRFVLSLKRHLATAWQWLTAPRGKDQSVLGAIKQLRPAVGNSGISQRRRLLLLVMLFLQSVPQVGSTVIIANWVATAILGVTFVFSTDREVGFDCILKAPGFGLLVDAYDLRRALEAALLQPPSDGQRDRTAALCCLRRYKATLFRMRDTLAVSYRWQEAVTPVGRSSPGDTVVGINQSRWQMSQMLEVLKETKLRYVWLDVLSVPQPPMGPSLAGLQRTLLSRMMAVYASSRVTLVLRSAEAPRGRYHQRAWTFQEYFASKSLVMRDETAVSDQPPDMENAPLCATCQSEQDAARSMRDMVQGSMHICCPFWIVSLAPSLSASQLAPTSTSGSAPTSPAVSHGKRSFRRSGSNLDDPSTHDRLAHIPDLDTRMRCFLELAPRLNCMDEADRVRALIPVLMNSPVERHEKLVELVGLLQQRFPSDSMSRFLRVIAAAGGADGPDQVNGGAGTDTDRGHGAEPQTAATSAPTTDNTGALTNGGGTMATVPKMFTRSSVEMILSTSMPRVRPAAIAACGRESDGLAMQRSLSV